MKGNAGVPLSPPPYGYIKNRTIPAFWVVEPGGLRGGAPDLPHGAGGVRAGGNGSTACRRWRGQSHLLLAQPWTSRGGSKSTVEPTKWGHTTVKKILTLQEYCGDVINFKSYSKVLQDEKADRKPGGKTGQSSSTSMRPSSDRQTWEKVQARQKGDTPQSPRSSQEPSVFSGLLKCPGAAAISISTSIRTTMILSFSVAKITTPAIASAARRIIFGWTFLEQVVLYEVKRLACFASEYENDFIKAMIGRSAKAAENGRIRKQRSWTL